MGDAPPRTAAAWDVQHAAARVPYDVQRTFTEHSALVLTPQMRMLAAGMPSALARGAATAVSGPAGCGKTTMLKAVTAVADPAVNTAFADITRGSTDRQVWEEIATAVLGVTVEGTARDMRHATLEHLVTHPTLLIVDEAQFIGRAGLLQLRWLWAHPFPNGFAIVLAGSDLFSHLDADESIASRINRRIALDHHTAATMVTHIQNHHRLAAITDRDLLVRINEQYAQGSWRKWSNFLAELRDQQHRGPITEQAAQQALTSITGRHIDLAERQPTRR